MHEQFISNSQISSWTFSIARTKNDKPYPSVKQSQNKLIKSLHAHNTYRAFLQSRKYFFSSLEQYFWHFCFMGVQILVLLWHSFVTHFCTWVGWDSALQKCQYSLTTLKYKPKRNIHLGTNVLTLFFSKKHSNIHSKCEYNYCTLLTLISTNSLIRKVWLTWVRHG